MTVKARTLVVARGNLKGESSALATRVALAMPLAGGDPVLILAGSAVVLALAHPASLGRRAPQLAAEFDALIAEEQVPVVVEREALEALGFDPSDLRPEVELWSSQQLAENLAGERCLVF